MLTRPRRAARELEELTDTWQVSYEGPEGAALQCAWLTPPLAEDAVSQEGAGGAVPTARDGIYAALLGAPAPRTPRAHTRLTDDRSSASAEADATSSRVNSTRQRSNLGAKINPGPTLQIQQQQQEQKQRRRQQQQQQPPRSLSVGGEKRDAAEWGDRFERFGGIGALLMRPR
ncbi:unnamed protein product [Lampetra fluviatilis]